MNREKTRIEHLVGLASTTTDALISIDSGGRVMSWNSSAEAMFGFAQEEMLGNPLHSIIPASFHKLHDSGIERVNKGGERHVIGKTVDLEAVRKDGSQFPISLTLSTWEVEGNRFYGGIIQDITDRVKLQHDLQNALHQSKAVFDSANDAIITANSEGKILSWNHAAHEIFGYKESEVVGKSLSIIVPEHYREAHDKGLKRVASGGEQHVIGKTVELAGQHKDGRLIPIELSLSTWLSDGDRCFSGIIRDISERKFHEEIQLTQNLKFQSITETATDAIISANHEGIIQSWNKAAENIFQYTADDVMGKSLTVIIPERYHEAHEAGIARVATGGKRHVIGKSVELEGRRKDGSELPIELSLSTWSVSGKVFYSGIIRDISERKKNEEQLRAQKEKLSKKAKELKELNEEVRNKNEQLQALSNKLAKYLSRQVYTNIFEGRKDVKIESYRKKLTVFFSDIEGFTELSDRVESEVLTAALNKYLNEMSKIAINYGGTIDKYIGDAIMIFFGDPDTLGEKNDAVACVSMAIEMRNKLAEMRRDWKIMGVTTPLRIRMGINTGFCTVGNFGSEERLDYTIVGSSVNLASRLESAADVDNILISEDTFSLVSEVIKCEHQGELKAKGFAYPVNTYKVIDKYDTLDSEKEHLNAQLQGFNLSIDFDKLNYTDKIYAKEMLKKAMSKLD